MLARLFFNQTVKTSCSKNRLFLEQFQEKRTVSDDTWNKVPNSEIHIQYLTAENEEIGYINYRRATGQIGLLFITNLKYERRGLGTQMVLRAINEMKQHNISKVWAITHDDHPYWNRALNFRPSQRPHNSVTGSGYEMDI